MDAPNGAKKQDRRGRSLAFLTILVSLSCVATFAERSSAESLTKALKRIERQTATNIRHASGVVDGVVDVARDNVKPGVLYTVTPAPQDDSAILESIKAQIVEGSPGSAIVPLPNMIRVRDAGGAVLDLKSFALAGRALQFDERTQTFNATVKVGVYEINGNGAQRTLSTPVIFEVLDAGVAVDAVGKVETTGPPYTEVRLAYMSPPSPRVVRVVSQTAPEGVAVPLLTSPSIEVHVQTEEIEGYGLEITPVTVFVQGVEALAGHPVVLSAPHGYFDKASYATDSKGMIVANLRSESTGDVTVSATIPGVGRGADVVEYTFPIRTLLFSLVGGLFGGLIRLLQRPPARVGQFLIKVVVSLLVGSVAFVLYVVGVNVTPIQPTIPQGSLLVFALSAVGAYLGSLRLQS